MTHRLRRLIRYPKFSLKIWLHRMLFWGGAVLVALAAMLFERTSTLGNHLFAQTIAIHPVLAFIITPLGFVGVLWLTRRVFPGAQGSGIPQTIAALKIPVLADRNAVLSLRLEHFPLARNRLGIPEEPEI